MSQSLCARCLTTLPPRRRQPGNILCDVCEAEWRREFERGLQHRLAKLSAASGPAPLDAGDQSILLTTD